MKSLTSQDRKFRKPVKVAQFGEGNFLRAFADHMIDLAGEAGVFDGGVAIIKPIPFGSLEKFEAADGLYTVILRGQEGGEKIMHHRIVQSISKLIDPFTDYDSFIELAKSEELRFVISNTTEAGIVFDPRDEFEKRPANSFPGKLVQLLYARYESFGGDNSRGLIILPVELIENNGKTLRECVQKLIELWELPQKFWTWVESCCIFCNCLVDRIVSGYPAAEADEICEKLLGYKDELLVVGEPFGFWAIESEQFEVVQKEFPLDKAGLPVVFTDNLRPYRERKVRILNGGHTASVLAAYLAGLDTVGNAVEDPIARKLIENTIYNEIAPTVNLPKAEVRAFADSVIERFENPFIRHELLSISLNSVSKWKTRVLPSLKDSFAKTGKLPNCLTFSLAALATFYRSDQRGEDCLIGRRGAEEYPIFDDSHVLDFFAKNSSKNNEDFANILLGNIVFWGEDLSKVPGMNKKLIGYLDSIERIGMRNALKLVLEA